MVRSLYSGVSGLTSHQTKMDVIGNNIANVNTYGFKSSRASFSDVFYQSIKNASSGTQSFAGNNPSTVGYGTQVASIDKDMSQSSFQSTNRTLDIALDKEGFFATATFVSGPNGTAPLDTSSPASLTYTRAGNFQIDSLGNLVTNNNRFVLGTKNSKEGLLLNGDNSAQTLNAIELQDNNGDNRVNSTDYTYANTLNVNELIATAYGIYTDETNGYMYTDRKPEAVIKDGEIVGYRQGSEIDETIDQTTGAVTDKHIYLCDKTGNYITREDDNGQICYFEYTPETTAADGTVTPASVSARCMELAADGTTSAGTADFATAPTLKELAVMDRFTYADLSGFSIGPDGVITTTYNNLLKAIGRIEVTVFDNPEGLIENGDTSYTETTASGEGKVRKAGDPGVGHTISNKLEMSNVNLAQEFSDMIVTQRGFQANARIITTSDSMLEELVNLKR